MKNFTFKFTGRKVGEPGEIDRFTVSIEAENQKAAALKLHDTHENIFILSVETEEIKNKIPNLLNDEDALQIGFAIIQDLQLETSDKQYDGQKMFELPGHGDFTARGLARRMHGFFYRQFNNK